MKSVLKIAFVIIASFVGAGFASGKEIYLFFFKYGINGIIGIVIACFLISEVIGRVLKICYQNNIKTYSRFCEYVIGNTKISRIGNNLINIFLLLSFFIMIAGFSSLLKQEFNINKIVGCLIILYLNYISSIKNVKGLMKISNILVPIFIVFIGLIALKCIELDEINMCKFNNTIFNNWFINSIIYVSYNCVILIPVIVMLSNKINDKRQIKHITTIIFVMLLFLSSAICILLSKGEHLIYAADMPIILVSKKIGKIYSGIYILLIGISIYTTAVSSSVSLLNNVLKNKNYINRLLIVISLIAIPISQLNFESLVGCLYTGLGLVGIVEIILIFFKPIKC